MFPNQGIQVLMLGGFGLFYNGEQVHLGKKQTSKPVQLLQLLLNNREQGVSRHTVTEALFGETPDIDVTNTLNVTVSQLRRILRESALPEDNYIRLRFDRYFFDSTCPVHMDVEVVTQLRQQADLQTGAEKLESLYQLCALFRGRFLPALDGTEWVEIARGHYQRIFRQSMGEICSLLEERHNYAEIHRMAEMAASIFPFDEWQIWQHDSLLAQGRLMDAQELYYRVAKLYRDELDAQPPEGMRLGLQKMQKINWRKPQTLPEAAQWLRQQEHPGPCRIPFPVFGEVYSRIRKELTSSAVLLLCTLPEGEHFMEKLEAVLQSCLGEEDIYTQYTWCQYLVICTGEREERITELARRIRHAFHEAAGTTKLHVQFQRLTD